MKTIKESEILMKNPNDMAAEFYDKIYYKYITSKTTKNELKAIKKHIKKGPVLDVACGTGRHMIPLLKAGYEVTGVDLSSGMLKVLKMKLKKNKLKGVVLNQNIKTFKSKRFFNGIDRKSTRLNSSHSAKSRMPSSA